MEGRQENNCRGHGLEGPSDDLASFPQHERKFENLYGLTLPGLNPSAGELYVARLHQAVDYIRERIQEIPKVAIVSGSGLGHLADRLEDPIRIKTTEIPGFSESTVPGHAGELVFGKIDGEPVVIQSGRIHLYEGRSASQAAFPVRALAMLGADNFIITNAAGSLSPHISPGTLIFITNDLSLGIESPSRGLVHPELGEMFYDVSFSYDKELIDIARDEANKLELKNSIGAYVQRPGPRYETAAEIALLQLQGELLRARNKFEVAPIAVGMSTAVEVHALRQMATVKPAIKILGISLITNFAAGIGPAEVNHEEVLETGNKTAEKLGELIGQIVRRVHQAETEFQV